MLAPLHEEAPIKICPSLLAADFSRLEDALLQVEAKMDYLHLDIMDGHFVPNISYGPDLVKSLRHLTSKPFDVHLMVEEPSRWFDAFAKAGADLLVFHLEATHHAQRLLTQIAELGVSAGIALNPGTPLSAIENLLPWLDLILLMTVNPGFGGQAYIPELGEKIRAARQMIDASGRPIRLQVDGGIKGGTIAEAAKAGADTFVAGSAIFRSEAPVEAIDALRAEAMEAAGVLG